jgi:hypothetical protein
MVPRRGAEFGVGISNSLISPVLASIRPIWRWRKSVKKTLFFGVRNHVVDIVRAGHALERLPGLEFAGGDIEPVHAGKAVVLGPDLAVDIGALRADHVDLGGVDVLVAFQRPELERGKPLSIARGN